VRRVQWGPCDVAATDPARAVLGLLGSVMVSLTQALEVTRCQTQRIDPTMGTDVVHDRGGSLAIVRHAHDAERTPAEVVHPESSPPGVISPGGGGGAAVGAHVVRRFPAQPQSPEVDRTARWVGEGEGEELARDAAEGSASVGWTSFPPCTTCRVMTQQATRKGGRVQYRTHVSHGRGEGGESGVFRENSPFW
jgi:hypothetical protein